MAPPGAACCLLLLLLLLPSCTTCRAMAPSGTLQGLTLGVFWPVLPAAVGGTGGVTPSPLAP